MRWLDALRARWPSGRSEDASIDDGLWHDTCAPLPFIAGLPAAQMQRLRILSALFLRAKEFHGANGLVITDAMALQVAVQAVLPLLHLPLAPAAALRWYDDFVGIVMHPGEVVAAREVVDDDGVVHHYHEVLAGEAMEGGPVMLSWRDTADAALNAQQGYNLVIHEFVHKIDMRDGQPDGCPPLASAAARRHWLALLEEAFADFRRRVIEAERFGQPAPWLDSYGAEAIDEFFAVAAEAYFVQRERFGREFPSLLTLFDSFFRPDGAAAP
jgi:MtfA peptidase